MKTTIKIDQIVVDNVVTIADELELGTGFEIMIYDATDEEAAIGMFLQHTDIEKDCTIMFEITKEQALFFGKSLIALSESI